MSLLPRIAIPIPTSIDQEYNRQCFPLYLAALTRARAEPVPVLLDGSAGDVVNRCEGVLLPGSLADVRPLRYGQERNESCGPADQPREAADLAMLDHADRFRKPVLGICYGLQSINVWRGGTLLQDLEVKPVNHAAGRSVAVAHAAAVGVKSQLGAIVDCDEAQAQADCLQLPVNSSHHQAVGAVGEGLMVSARCPLDGVIEALELSQQHAGPEFLVGVQWHPERSVEHSATSRALFEALAVAALG